jgi:hypothetical protein
VLRITRGEAGSDRWQFEAHAETASWVSSFFQARDRFVTTTDAGFHPLEHSRDIREGRRELRRTYVYDRRARHVRVGESPEAALASSALTLPFESEAARDALSALYYVRTLPLTPGTIITVPLNEAGTNMLLQVSTGEVETIEHHGQSARALRLEPRLMRRLERRRPLAMTIWLSDDARRVPLRAIVEAGFGKVRLELIEYSR